MDFDDSLRLSVRGREVPCTTGASTEADLRDGGHGGLRRTTLARWRNLSAEQDPKSLSGPQLQFGMRRAVSALANRKT